MAPVIILCGGYGLRMRELSETTPKPLIPIGGIPIIRHIINYYMHYNCGPFILAVGHKANLIQEYFAANPLERGDIFFDNAGESAGTAQRINNIFFNYNFNRFFLSYGDTLCDMDLNLFYQHHNRANVPLTIAAVKPILPYGVFSYKNSVCESFAEKPRADFWVNSGYMILEREIEPFIKEEVMFEGPAFNRLISAGKLAVYQHHGLWKCMDTYKEYLELNELWQTRNSFWVPKH